MKWTDEKLQELKDNYAYMDLNELSDKIGCTKKALIRRAQKLKLYRAKNNEIIDGYKFCSLCKVMHPVSSNSSSSSFFRNKSKYGGYEYYCKKYYEKDGLKKENLNSSLTPPLLKQKRASATDNHSFETREVVKHRPINPVVIQNGVQGKVCNWCKDFKPLNEYGNDVNGIAGKKATCKQCYKERYSKKRV